ncbi:MAG: hypothetical protein N4A33_08090 [Bacteriovoracaceae bacterium]|jgi:hypothetical protein|nr:hypothetical protein [Bacteriovoracaceae bacterium]
MKYLILLLVVASAQANISILIEDNNAIKTNIIEQQDNLNFMLDEDLIPWESSYWPFRAGSIAYRHKEMNRANFNLNLLSGTKPYIRKLRRILDKNSKIFYKLTDKEISKFSAAEKYDFLVGDKNFSLTRGILDRIELNQKKWKRTTFWTGICHGWAPASIYFKNPKNSKKVISFNGNEITFSKDDLKALSSYYFSNSVSDKKLLFFGNRCNIKKPKKDSKTKLVKKISNYTRNESECSDIKAHDFHNLMINKLGIRKESFVVDIDYNSVVNNHPVAGYKISFPNHLNFKRALKKLSHIRSDKFKKLRNPKSVFVLKTNMKVYYTNWTRTGQYRENKPDNKRFLIKNYDYELELDEDYNIVDSKWLNTTTKVWAPDFIWAYPKSAKVTEYYYKDSVGYEFKTDELISNELSLILQKSTKNKIKLSYLNRLKSHYSKEEKIFKEALKYAQFHKIKLIETKEVFEPKLNHFNIPTHMPNPQIASIIIHKLLSKK